MVIAFEILLIIIMFISLGLLVDNNSRGNSFSYVLLCVASMVTMFSVLMWL